MKHKILELAIERIVGNLEADAKQKREYVHQAFPTKGELLSSGGLYHQCEAVFAEGKLEAAKEILELISE
jgi:hypothetical protein